jgi:hypothetical protein
MTNDCFSSENYIYFSGRRVLGERWREPARRGGESLSLIIPCECVFYKVYTQKKSARSALSYTRSVSRGESVSAEMNERNIFPFVGSCQNAGMIAPDAPVLI